MKQIINLLMKGKSNECKARIIHTLRGFGRVWCVLACSICILSGCDRGADGEGVSGNFNLEGKPITKTTFVYETQAEVRAVCTEIMGSGYVEQGCAIATYDPFNGHRCTVHVAKIRSVTDNARINTWGHEDVHCLYGLWHP